MCKFSGHILFACCLLLCVASTALAVEVVPLPPQVPARTPSGSTNLTDVWLHNGGGRVYWNTLVTPKQVDMEGARFADPAAVPELATAQPPEKKVAVKRHVSRAKVAKPAPQAAGQPPKNAGKTALIKPVPAAGAGGASGFGSASAANANGVGNAPNSSMPYSSLAPTVGAGGAATGQAASVAGAAMPPLPDVPVSPAPLNADDILPRANARP